MIIVYLKGKERERQIDTDTDRDNFFLDLTKKLIQDGMKSLI